MDKARALFKEGNLDQAIQTLNASLRDHPEDTQARTFLFELLCFSGNWDRAEKQLEVLGSNQASTFGSMYYMAAISAERTRQERFQQKDQAAAAADSKPIRGSLNGKPFSSISDADPRIGSRLEVFSGGTYFWIPLEHILTVEMEPPKLLRDLLWATAKVRTGPSFQGADLGEVLLPVLSPLSWQHADNNVRLGRMTVWEADEEHSAIPFGQKMFVIDDEEVPILEVRQLEIFPSQMVN